jgi:type VI secretion system protein ImpG
LSDDLLSYYDRELAYFRRLSGEFAKNHPKAATALELGPEGSEDPHVERLIMAFAFLTARIRHKLDDDFPELTDGLLATLYPHLAAPIPSLSIVQFDLDRGETSLTQGYLIKRHAMLESEPVRGESCRFRTAFNTTLWPIDVAAAELGVLPSSAAFRPEGATGLLKLKLACFDPAMAFRELELSRLRFYLNGQAQYVYALYELLFNHTVEVTVTAGGEERRLGADALQTVGFAGDEALLPYSPRSFPGYRFLAEFFAFPRKFCFVDLAGFSPDVLGAAAGSELELRFYLDQTATDLEETVSADTFRLGCTPVVNLFERHAEPILLTHTETEYHVVPNRRALRSTEVYSIDRVTATDPGGGEHEYQPFYSFRHALGRDLQETFWYAARRPSSQEEHKVDHGSEMYLTLVDLGFSPSAPADWTVHVDVTCMNRDLPRKLPYGGGQPVLRLDEGGPLAGIQCLIAPTATVRPERRRGAMWRLVSQLSLNYLSVADPEGKPDALKEILKLYDFTDSPEAKARIQGIAGVESRRTISRVRADLGGAGDAVVRGVEVTVEFDEKRYADNSLFLFATVLERFLALYCSVNSFSQLSIRTTQRRDEVLRQWKPRAGERVLL